VSNGTCSYVKSACYDQGSKKNSSPSYTQNILYFSMSIDCCKCKCGIPLQCLKIHELQYLSAIATTTSLNCLHIAVGHLFPHAVGRQSRLVSILYSVHHMPLRRGIHILNPLVAFNRYFSTTWHYIHEHITATVSLRS